MAFLVVRTTSLSFFCTYNPVGMVNIATVFEYHALLFLIFLGVLLLAHQQQSNRLLAKGCFAARPYVLLGLQLAGIVLFGVLPYDVPHLSYPVICPGRFSLVAFSFVVLLATAALLAGRQQARKETATSVTPLSQLPGWPFLLVYLVFRLLFIAAYENWFRGFLLIDSLALLPLTAAMALNGFLYAALHCINGEKEMIGCLPFGWLLCGLCIWWGATWPAILIHLMLTLGYEWQQWQLSITKTSSYAHTRYRSFWLYR
jgi:hypothetical protein